MDEARELLIAVLRMRLHWATYDENLWRSGPSILRELPKWAARPGQIPERIRQALVDLEAAARLRPPHSVLAKANHANALAVLDQIESGVAGFTYSKESWRQLRHLHWLNRCLPGERARARRIVNYQLSRCYPRLEAVEQRLSEGHGVQGVLPGPESAFDDGEYRDGFYQETPRLHGTSLSGNEAWILHRALQDECEWRSVRILLALQLWRAEHDGKLPERLADLVGVCLDELPRDPYTGESFIYFPRGVDLDKPESRYVWGGWGHDGSVWGSHATRAGTPMIWAASALHIRQPTEDASYHASEMLWGWTQDPFPKAQEAILLRGYAYPIPLSAPLPTFPPEPGGE